VPEPEVTPPPVRQRNTTGYMVNVAETADHPAYTVQPGEEAEFPALLDGWTALDDSEPEAKTDENVPKQPTRKRTPAADTDTKDGGESR
jgi:hypothetical protein